MAALEALRTMNDANLSTHHPVALVNWTNEEGGESLRGADLDPTAHAQLASPSLYMAQRSGQAISLSTLRMGWRT